MADCCARIHAEIDRIQEFEFWENQDYWPYLRDILGLPAGAFIPIPTGEEVPSLDELLGRLSTPLDTGFGDWEWYNIGQPGKKILTLPQAPTTAKTEVWLNSVALTSPRDYSIAGDQLTFVYGLDVGDLVHVKTYGA